MAFEPSVDSSAHRFAMDPELRRRFGITRIGDVTDLDIIGVPVWFATRPNSRGLSVSQGKGLTAEQARISAVMEAVEGAVAEDTQKHVHSFGSIAEMQSKNLLLVPFEKIGRVDLDLLCSNRERAWVKGVSVRHGQEIFAPFELVGMDFRVDFPWDRQAFHMSSQGLAAGFDYDRTILHGLLELVENDACFLIDTFETRNMTPGSVLLPEGVNGALDALIQHLAERGLSPEFYNLTSRLGVPVIMAGIGRSVFATDGPGGRHAAGVACRLNGHDAALAALLEAVQSRLTDISGARDDLSPERYRRDAFARPHAPIRPSAEAGSLCVDLSSYDQVSDWKRLVRHLFEVGIEDVFIFALETGVPDLHVVRVLASGLKTSGSGLQKMTLQSLDGFVNGRVSE